MCLDRLLVLCAAPVWLRWVGTGTYISCAELGWLCAGWVWHRNLDLRALWCCASSDAVRCSDPFILLAGPNRARYLIVTLWIELRCLARSMVVQHVMSCNSTRFAFVLLAALILVRHEAAVWQCSAAARSCMSRMCDAVCGLRHLAPGCHSA
jgi:hypothetical protein